MNITWEEFLQQIKTLKKDYKAGQVDLRAGPLVTLLYAGAFDTMLGREPTFTEYKGLSSELLTALGSKAALPKAKKGEILGIADIKATIDLHLWRSEMSPTYKFDIAALFEQFILSLRFLKTTGDLSYRRPALKNCGEILVFRNSKTVFENLRFFDYVNQKGLERTVGIVGIVRDFQVRKTKAGREMGTFRMFLGDGSSDLIYIWPIRGEDFLPYVKTQFLKNGQSGIVTARPAIWNNNRQYVMDTFAPTNDKKKG